MLPEAQMQMLRDIAAHARRRALVYSTWGMGDEPVAAWD